MASNVRSTLRILVFLTAALVPWSTASAQELKELRLADGRVVTGRVKASGDQIEVETRDGNVTVSGRDVVMERDRNALLKALRDKEKGTDASAFALVQLASLARDYMLTREMWRYLDRALEKLPPDHIERPDATTRHLRDFLAGLEPELLSPKVRQAPTDKRVSAILKKFVSNTKDSIAAALVELLVREPDADKALRKHARRNASTYRRIAAVSALQRRKLAGNDRFVLRTAILDRNKKVREAAVDIGKAGVLADNVSYMASGLAHPVPKVRIRTAEALGGLGHDAAIDLLVKAGPLANSGLRRAGGNGASPRGHVAFLQQKSYIRDFDVEVAQAAFIADPKIDVLNSGSVLDVTVAGVAEIRTIVSSYRTALRQLANSDPGPDPRRWSEWRAQLPKPATPVETARR